MIFTMAESAVVTSPAICKCTNNIVQVEYKRQAELSLALYLILVIGVG